MMNSETEPAFAAARAAAEHRRAAAACARCSANARITSAVARYLAGAAEAFAELARGHRALPGAAADQPPPGGAEPRLGVAGGGRPGRLGPAGRRAAHRWTSPASTAWPPASPTSGPGRTTPATGRRRCAMAAESTRRPTAEWDLHIVAVSGWIAGCCGGDPDGPGDGGRPDWSSRRWSRPGAAASTGCCAPPWRTPRSAGRCRAAATRRWRCSPSWTRTGGGPG